MGEMSIRTALAPSSRATRRASLRLPGFEVRYGMRTHRTRPRPSARQARAAAVAESTPPDSPSTRREKSALAVSFLRNSTSSASASGPSRSSSGGDAVGGRDGRSITPQGYARAPRPVNALRAGARPGYNASARARHPLHNELKGAWIDDSGDATSGRHGI